MGKLPFSCKQCGGSGEAEVSSMMGVQMTCEYCGAMVAPPHFDVRLEPPDVAIKPMVLAVVGKLLGIGLVDALKIVNDTRIIGTKVSAEIADRQRATLEKVGAKVTLIVSI
jgi:ribosomal protein L7/L12